MTIDEHGKKKAHEEEVSAQQQTEALTANFCAPAALVAWCMEPMNASPALSVIGALVMVMRAVAAIFSWGSMPEARPRLCIKLRCPYVVVMLEVVAVFWSCGSMPQAQLRLHKELQRPYILVIVRVVAVLLLVGSIPEALPQLHRQPQLP